MDLNQIITSNLIIDKLTITLPVTSVSEQSLIKKWFMISYNQKGKLSILGTVGYNNNKIKFRYKLYAFPKASDFFDEHIYIQCEPFDGSDNFFRIDFNPSKVSMAKVRAIVDQVIPQNGYKRLIEHGKITRIDLAFNLEWVLPHNLYFHVPYFKVGKGYYKSGDIQSLYLGDEESNQYVIYDKKVEIEKKNKNKGVKDAVPENDLTRVEYRYRPEPSITFLQLVTMDNPFKKLTVIAYPPKLVSSDSVLRLLFACSRFQGLGQALLNIEKHKRKKYLKLVKESGSSDFYNPDKIWESFSAAVYKLVHPYENLLTTA
jgi:hypothetical protein